MTLLKVPLRAGQRAGWPVVTWAKSSEVTLTAVAMLAVEPTAVSAVSGQVTVTAIGSLHPVIGRVDCISASAVARMAAQSLRAVPGSASVTSVAQNALLARIWAPTQPEGRVTYRRYSRDDYHQMLMDLLPRGRAWPRDGEDADLMFGWAAEYARLEQRGWDLLDEIDPRTTKEMMPDWERFFALPGTASEVQRRKELIAAWLAGGTLSRDDIDNLLQVLGIKASVYYWRPFRCGVSTCGDPLATEWYSTWTVTVFEPKDLDLVWLQDYLRKLAPGGDWVHVVAGY